MRPGSTTGRILLDARGAVLVGALAAMGASYALGFGLDWKMLEPAPAPAPAAEAPAPGMAASAAPVPGWAADPRDQAWEEMTRQLSALTARHRGRLSIHLKDLRTNKTWTHNPDDLFPSASLVKVPIMACVFAKIREGRMSLNETLVLRRRFRVGGSGSLKWSRDGTRLTVRELLQRMISESDNTATAMLIDAVGWGYVQRQFPQMGLVYTGIYQEGMSIRGGKVAHENYTTAREMSMLMEKIYRGELVDGPSSRLMLDILRHKKAVASRLAKGLPRGWEIAHKTGLLRRACHDTAVFLTPQGDYALTVLTGQNSDYKRAKDFITRIGRITFAHYGAARYYAKAVRRHGQSAPL